MTWKYIAGFFDGEGSISPNGKGFRITIPQTNEEVLNKICDFAKCGYIIKLKKRKAHWKDCWLYYIACKKDVCKFLKKIAPYLVLKKKKASIAIFQLEKDLVLMKQKENMYKKRKSRAKLLREKGWSYRKIGKELKIDWGYARRLILDLK